jgi:hypothetical protein
MILVWPLVGLIAGWVAWRRRGVEGGRGWSWFVGWTAAGFLISFSLITGFSIGLFVLPFAAWMLIWVAQRAPHLAEASGFAAGVGATIALVVVIQG